MIDVAGQLDGMSAGRRELPVDELGASLGLARLGASAATYMPAREESLAILGAMNAQWFRLASYRHLVAAIRDRLLHLLVRFSNWLSHYSISTKRFLGK